jgi:rhodanese-related sulfurtransferase
MSGYASVIARVIAIVALGSAIGLADAFVVRPISLGRDQTTSVEDVLRQSTAPSVPAGQSAPGVPDSTREVAPAKTPPVVVSPAPTPAPTPAPAAGFTPTPKSSMPSGHITIDEAKQLFDNGGTFIDSRRKEKYEAQHVKGAWRIELSDFSGGNPPVLAMIPRDSVIVVYCGGGNCDESEKVAQMLNGSGYSKVFVLHDGVPGWAAMGHPTEAGPGMMP